MTWRAEQGPHAIFINDWLITGAGIRKPNAWNFCGAANPEPELTEGPGTSTLTISELSDVAPITSRITLFQSSYRSATRLALLSSLLPSRKSPLFGYDDDVT